eukprot:TRINITY_DN2879_c1_g3_i1.p2 TRINITY_DN2879_c1_g3~~TRINITY_DN2879_c1_g3_i1.p2  ORF type:complete len:385 (-),score=38.14 TRINITY_DN2879_c1_g3_i1:1949-3103(-)
MSLRGIQNVIDGLRRDDCVSLTNLFEQNAILPDQVVPWTYPGTEQPVVRRTLLQVAAYYGSTSCMRTLLGRGAAVNCVSVDDGKTALDCALEGNNVRLLETVRLLLENGATLDHGSAAGLGITLPTTSAPRPDTSDLSKPQYQSDGFRMYGFKIAECTKVTPHDWTNCPFLHSGEKARRRDPRQFSYTAEPCPDYRRGTCKRGDICGYAHGVFEAWLHPSKYRTQLCKDGLACNRQVCFFAHHLAELRAADGPVCDKSSSVGSPTTSLNLNKTNSIGSPTSSMNIGSPTSSIVPHALLETQVSNVSSQPDRQASISMQSTAQNVAHLQKLAATNPMESLLLALASLQLPNNTSNSAAQQEAGNMNDLLNNFVSQSFGSSFSFLN